MAGKIKIVTFNLRNLWTKDGINGFVHRAGFIYDKINKELPDAIAFQEIMPEQLELLRLMLPQYDFFGQGRNADFGGEGLYTAVKRDSFILTFYETFWISPTPHIPASRFEDQSPCPRICVVTTLRHKESGKMIRLLNIHLDHMSDKARIEGIHCVVSHMKKYEESEVPFIILGDFNALPDSETIRFCNEQKQPLLNDITSEIPASFHNFGRTVRDEKIDYLFVSQTLKDATIDVGIWDTVHEGIYLSDHYPVYADFDTDKI